MEAVEILCKSRKQLMLLNIFAYWANPHTEKEIFKMNQNDLQLAIDKLSKCLKQEVTNDNAAGFVQNVRDSVS